MVSLLVWLLSSGSLFGDDQADLLNSARMGHRAARESIHTFSATIAIDSEIMGNKLAVSGNYWRSGGLTRVREERQTLNPGVEDFLVKESRIYQVGLPKERAGVKSVYGARLAPASASLGLCDLWTLMLLEFMQPNSRCDYEEFVRDCKTVKARKETVRGHTCVQVTLVKQAPNGEDHEVILWHDPHYNYLIIKMQVSYSGNGNRDTVEFPDFMEAPAGTFFPVRRRMDSRRDGKVVNQEVLALTDVRINESVPGDVFRLPTFPPGTMCRDDIQGTRYPIDQNWHPTGQATQLPPKQLIETPLDSNALEYGSQSADEPKPWSRWVLRASVLVLLSALGLGLFRVLRRGRSDKPARAG